MDLARLYAVETKRLNEAVRRNRNRFPDLFMFQLTKEELENLRSQIATTSKCNIRYLPYVFTEHGVLMGARYFNPKRIVQILKKIIEKQRRAAILIKRILSAPRLTCRKALRRGYFLV